MSSQEQRRPAKEMRWRPPLDLLLASTSLTISIFTIILTSPLLIAWFFPPKLILAQTYDGNSSSSYELKNEGWTTAHNVKIDFDVFVKIHNINIRPNIGDLIKSAKDENFIIAIPALSSGEIVRMNFSFNSEENSFIEKFGPMAPYNLRSDEGAGRLTFIAK